MNKKTTLQTLLQPPQAVLFLSGLLSLIFSLFLWATGNHLDAIFVGLWVPSIWTLMPSIEIDIKKDTCCECDCKCDKMDN